MVATKEFKKRAIQTRKVAEYASKSAQSRCVEPRTSRPGRALLSAKAHPTTKHGDYQIWSLPNMTTTKYGHYKYGHYQIWSLPNMATTKYSHYQYGHYLIWSIWPLLWSLPNITRYMHYQKWALPNMVTTKVPGTESQVCCTCTRILRYLKLSTCVVEHFSAERVHNNLDGHQ